MSGRAAPTAVGPSSACASTAAMKRNLEGGQRGRERVAVSVRARARLRAPYRRAVTPKPGHIPPPSAKQKSAGSRGRSEPLSAAECEQYRHAACHAA